jgi:tRNA A-37 threonylcarbamoyl transferase component Bud32
MAIETLGAYRIVSQVGSGAFGVVYEGHQPFLDRRVALKTLRDVLMDDRKSESAFMGEARTIARLRHPNIVTVYEFGTAQVSGRATAYMAMEFLAGQSLHERLSAGALPLNSAFDLLDQVAAGIDYAHERGVIHRDLKPANILFTEHGQAVIVDFGLAKLIELAGAGSGTAVQASDAPAESTVSGTPMYMSPEQLLGQRATAATDLYAFATIAYQVLTGHLPYEEDGNPNVFLERLHLAPTPFSQHLPQYGKKADAVFDKALHRDPSQRYPSARAFVSALADVLVPDRRRERVVTVVDPAQAEALRMARQTLRGFMWGVVALTVVVMVIITAQFYRGFADGTPEFVTDGLEIRPKLEGETYRTIVGVFPGGPADLAGMRVGDQVVADLETDRRDEAANYTINSIKRSMYGVNWQPQLGDRVTRRVFRGDEVLDITVILDRGTQALYELVALAIPGVMSVLAAVWVLRRWGDEPNGQMFAALMLVQGLALVSTGTVHVNIDFAQISFMIFFALMIDFMLRFPTPARRIIPRRLWLVRLLYVPVLLPVYQFLTGQTVLIGTLDVGFTLFLVYIGIMLVVQTLKWLRVDTRRFKGVWVLLAGNYTMGAVGAFSTYLAIAGASTQPPFDNASIAQLVLFGALSVGAVFFTLTQVIGFQMVQRQLGPSIVTTPAPPSTSLAGNL